jgi:hypothetical protein
VTVVRAAQHLVVDNSLVHVAREALVALAGDDAVDDARVASPLSTAPAR